MSVERPPSDDTRKALKVFGVTVTDYQDRARQLLHERATASTAEELERVHRQAAELTAELNRALQEITTHVLQLQSDFLMELVAREGAGDQHQGR